MMAFRHFLVFSQQNLILEKNTILAILRIGSQRQAEMEKFVAFGLLVVERQENAEERRDGMV